MPTYTFYCYKCRKHKEVFRPMGEAREPEFCNCGQEMVRDFRRDLVNVGDKDYARPIHSDSLAIMPSQVAEHKRDHPDIKLDSECRPVFTSYRQHNKYLDKCGFEKQRQRIRKRTKKLA